MATATSATTSPRKRIFTFRSRPVRWRGFAMLFRLSPPLAEIGGGTQAQRKRTVVGVEMVAHDGHSARMGSRRETHPLQRSHIEKLLDLRRAFRFDEVPPGQL